MTRDMAWYDWVVVAVISYIITLVGGLPLERAAAVVAITLFLVWVFRRALGGGPRMRFYNANATERESESDD